MAVNLRNVLARIAIRCAEKNRHRLVDHMISIDHMTKGQHATVKRLSVLRPEDPRQDALAFAAAHADDGNAAFAAGRCLRRDCVAIAHSDHAVSSRLSTNTFLLCKTLA